MNRDAPARIADTLKEEFTNSNRYSKLLLGMEAHVLITKEMYDSFFSEADDKVKKEDSSELDRVLDCLPARSKKIGERLLKFIWNKGARWNANGEILVENGQPLMGSNVVDLLRDSVHPLKFIPNKARDFYAYCARINVPRSLVANTSRRDWISNEQIGVPTVSDDVDIDEWIKLS